MKTSNVCPTCGEELVEEGVFCQHCGTQIGESIEEKLQSRLERMEQPKTETEEIAESVIKALGISFAVVFIVFNVFNLINIFLLPGSAGLFAIIPLIIVNVVAILAIVIVVATALDEDKSIYISVKERVNRLTGYPDGLKHNPLSATFSFFFTTFFFIIFAIVTFWMLTFIPGFLINPDLLLLTFLLFIIPSVVNVGIQLLKIPLGGYPQIRILEGSYALLGAACLVIFVSIWSLDVNAIPVWIGTIPQFAFIGGWFGWINLNFWLDLALKFAIIVFILMALLNFLGFAVYVDQKYGALGGIFRWTRN